MIETVYALWHGGSGYSMSEHDDLETFASLDAACDEFRTRHESGRWNHFAYADGRESTADTPCVDDDTEMWIFFADPRSGDSDWYPDRRIIVDRDDARVEYC